MQLFYIPNIDVSPNVLPKNTVCVAYIKKQSISNLNNLVTKLMASESENDPSTGIFTMSFVKQSGKYDYYSISFDWRERNKEELEHLKIIKEFWNVHHQNLIDIDGTRDMYCINGLSANDIQQLIDEAKQQILPETNNGKVLIGK